jgi:hypothetical protein
MVVEQVYFVGKVADCLLGLQQMVQKMLLIQ